MILSVFSLYRTFTDAPTENEYLACENSDDITEQINDWDIFTQAIINVESRGIDSIEGMESAAGCLQIRPIYLSEANRILGCDKYVLSDRYDRQKSIEMFNVVNSYHNPQRDHLKALIIHNGANSKKYQQKVFDEYSKLKSKSNYQQL